MSKALVAFLFAASLFAISVRAQDSPCSDLLRHGIYDHFRETGNSYNQAITRKNVCDAFGEYRHDKTNGNVKATYGLFDGSVTIGVDQLLAISKQMCESDDSQTTAQKIDETSKDLIDERAVNAWKACNEQYAMGLRTSTVFTEDDIGVKAVTIKVNWVSTLPSSPAFKGITMVPDNSFSCKDGDLAKLGIGVLLGNSMHTLSCTRIVKDEAVTEQGRKIYAPAATLIIETEGASITRTFTPIYAAKPPESIAQGQVVQEKTYPLVPQGSLQCISPPDNTICPWGVFSITPKAAKSKFIISALVSVSLTPMSVSEIHRFGAIYVTAGDDQKEIGRAGVFSNGSQERGGFSAHVSYADLGLQGEYFHRGRNEVVFRLYSVSSDATKLETPARKDNPVAVFKIVEIAQ